MTYTPSTTYCALKISEDWYGAIRILAAHLNVTEASLIQNAVTSFINSSGSQVLLDTLPAIHSDGATQRQITEKDFSMSPSYSTEKGPISPSSPPAADDLVELAKLEEFDIATWLRTLVYNKVKAGQTVSEIAAGAGYDRAGVIDSFCSGAVKVPLDHVYRLAAALDEDPLILLYLGIGQWPDLLPVQMALKGSVPTKREQRIVECIRLASNYSDPQPTPELEAKIRAVFVQRDFRLE